ncbi:hypothetical protein [Pseudogemmobacter sp. W21_MBD1_M6]|uniref:hypothetical protein n=1 Tax=Pseudogemmobacter sp. W21_MBD1_M6 TaxID=3240271 RepID=UPI003F9D1E39
MRSLILTVAFTVLLQSQAEAQEKLLREVEQCFSYATLTVNARQERIIIRYQPVQSPSGKFLLGYVSLFEPKKPNPDQSILFHMVRKAILLCSRFAFDGVTEVSELYWFDIDMRRSDPISFLKK